MAGSGQAIERVLGLNWVIPVSIDTEAEMAAVTTLMRIFFHGEEVFQIGGAAPDPQVKRTVFSISPVQQATAGFAAGLYEYRVDASAGGETFDQASGIFYVRD